MADLLFIVHGYNGDPDNFREAADDIAQEWGSRVLVHRCTSNLGRTDDGVDSGGERIVEEVRVHVEELKSKQVSIRSVSFWGHSLGGLYVRYALRFLADVPTRTVCGLPPRLYFTTVCPHLGVVGTFLQSVIEKLPKSVGGRSRLQVEFDDDKEWLLYKLAVDDHYIAALEMFPYRATIANVCNDALVDFCTAAMQKVWCPTWAEFTEPVAEGFPHVVYDTGSWTSFLPFSDDREPTSADSSEHRAGNTVRIHGSISKESVPPYYAGYASEALVDKVRRRLTSISWRLICTRFDDGLVYNEAHGEIIMSPDIRRFIAEVLLKDPFGDVRLERRKKKQSQEKRHSVNLYNGILCSRNSANVCLKEAVVPGSVTAEAAEPLSNKDNRDHIRRSIQIPMAEWRRSPVLARRSLRRAKNESFVSDLPKAADQDEEESVMAQSMRFIGWA